MANHSNQIIDYDVIIVGGNVIGAAAALALVKIGLKVALIEKQPPTEWNINQPNSLRVSAVIPVVKNFLEQLGIWQELKRIQPVKHMLVWEKDIKNQCKFDSDEERSEALAWIIENNQMQYFAWELIKKSTIKVLQGQADSIQTTNESYKVEVITTDKQKVELNTSLLIGADGSQSFIRQQSGILWKERPYKQHCIVGNVTTEKEHQSTAWQTYQQGLAFAFLPLSSGESSVAWYVKEEESKSILGQSLEQQKKEMLSASGGSLGTIVSLENLASFPIKHGSAQSMVASNLVLIGDAVRTIHPMAGQGINLGLQDVMVLQNTLLSAKEKNIRINHPLVLKKYARKRSEYVFVQKGMDIFNHFFASSLIQPIRPTLLKVMNRLTSSKKTLSIIAMGYKTDLPKIYN